MQGSGIGRGDTARAVHTSDIACAMPLTMKWRCDDMGQRPPPYRIVPYERRDGRPPPYRVVPTSVVMGARWVLMRLMHSSLFTAAYCGGLASSVIIGCDDRRARRVLALVLAHNLA